MFGCAVHIHIYKLLCIYPAGIVYMHIYCNFSKPFFIYLVICISPSYFGYMNIVHMHFTQLFWTSENYQIHKLYLFWM